MPTNQVEPASNEREQALERLKKRRDFQGHVVTYLIVNAALWAIWAAAGAGLAGLGDRRLGGSDFC